MITSPRFLHVLYCEDVRQEVGNKFTYAGVYQGGLTIYESSPVTIPKLCMVVTLQTPIERPFHSIKIKIMQDHNVIHTLAVPQETIEAGLRTMDSIGEARFGVFGLVLNAQKIHLTSNCVLRVQAETESEELFSTALDIVLAPPDTVQDRLAPQEV